MVMLNIEPTDYCNAKCLYCANGTQPMPHHYRGGFLPLDAHDKIFQVLEEFLNDFICMPAVDNNVYLRYCGVGEPLLHPQFINMIKKGISSSKVKILAVLSNGTEWNSAFINELVSEAKKAKDTHIELVFSLDTLNEQTQFKIKKLRNIQKIVDSLLFLLDKIAVNNLSNIHPVFQFIVLEENETEAVEFCNFWVNAFNTRKLSYKIVYDPTYTKYFSESNGFIWFKCRDADQSTQGKYFRLHESVSKSVGLNPMMKGNEVIKGVHQQEIPCGAQSEYEKFKNICSIMWYGINVAASGDVSPCCIDTGFSLKIGNIKQDSLQEMYRSEALRCLRMAHLRGGLEGFSLCRGCSFPAQNLPAWEEDIVKYLSFFNQVESA